MKTLLTFVTALLFFPLFASAGTNLTFSPASPQVYNGTSDITTVTTDVTGNFVWVYFKVSGAVFCNGCAWPPNTTGVSFASIFGANFQTFAGSAGDVKVLYVDQTQGDYNSKCTSAATGTYANCLTSTAYSSGGSIAPVTYTLCNVVCAAAAQFNFYKFFFI